MSRFFKWLLCLSLSMPAMGADLVSQDEPPRVPEQIEQNECRPQSSTTPAPIPIQRIEGVEKLEVASSSRRSSIQWGSVLAVGAGAAIGAAIGFFGYKAYRDYRDSKNTPPPPAPPVSPYIYPAPPQYVPYPYALTAPGRKPVYVFQPAPLGPAPSVLPPIYSPYLSYPVYPQTTLFGPTVSPIYYPTYNFSGVPTWGI